MVRSREMVSGLSRGVRRAAVFALVAMVVAPACAGRSISPGDDDEENPPVPGNDDDRPPVPGDDDDGTGRGGQGGVGAVGVSGTVGNAGNTVQGGAFPTGGAISMGGTSTTGGSPGMAGGPSGGSGAVPTGGTSNCGGAVGDPVAGSGGMLPINTDVECRGISRGQACPVEGKMCPNLACGLADGGRRQCACAGTIWECTSCDFTGSRWATPPCDLQPCPDGIADEVACISEGTACTQAAIGEVCACWLSPSDGLSWDCDAPPPTWAF